MGPYDNLEDVGFLGIGYRPWMGFSSRRKIKQAEDEAQGNALFDWVIEVALGQTDTFDEAVELFVQKAEQEQPRIGALGRAYGRAESTDKRACLVIQDGIAKLDSRSFHFKS